VKSRAGLKHTLKHTPVIEQSQAHSTQHTAPSHCFALTMERLFSPCTRYQDILESQGRHERSHSFHELDLDVSTEEVIIPHRAFTYADLYAMLGNDNTIAWLTPHAAEVARKEETVQCRVPCCFRFSADGQEIIAFSRSPVHLLKICDVVLRLLAASIVHEVIIHKCISLDGAFILAPALGYLLEQCQSLNS
jgi:hypothetical protein